MIEIKQKEKCCGCTACKNICPQKCIEMRRDEEGFSYPVVDKKNCINCNQCEKVCQYINQLDNMKTKKEVYACTLKDNQNANKSSTVGIFYYIASEFLKENGIVYGASYDKNMKVVHSEVRSLNELDKLRGSKYVQSELSDIYLKIKENLKNGKKVLFSRNTLSGCRVI